MNAARDAPVRARPLHRTITPMNRRVGLAVAVVLPVLLISAVASSTPTPMWHEPTADFDLGVDEREVEPVEAPPPPDPVVAEPEQHDGGGSSWLTDVLAALGIAAAAALLYVLVKRVLARRPKPRTAIGDLVEPVIADVPRELADASADSDMLLAGGTPRNAIVACWVRLERAAGEAGLTRRAAETSAEFTERVLARYVVDAAALTELADLYREARFSTHPLNESHRQRARAALDELHRQLRHPSVAATQ